MRTVILILLWLGVLVTIAFIAFRDYCRYIKQEKDKHESKKVNN